MATSDAIRRDVAIAEESTFATAPGDWDTGPTQVYVFDCDTSGLGQASLTNDNYHTRPEPWHQNVQGLKSGGTVGMSAYLTATGASTGEGASPTAVMLDKMARACWGGIYMGLSDGIAAGSASAPTVDNVGNWDIGDFGFFTDATTGKAYLRQIKAKPGGSVVTPQIDLPFTPDGAGADTVHSAIHWFFDTDALSNNADSEHKTLSIFLKGDHAEDLYELLGCKGTMQLSGLAQGEKPMLRFGWLPATFTQETLTEPALAGTPEGEPPTVVATGTDTIHHYGDQGGTLSTFVVYSVSVTANHTWTADMGPGGTEGVHYWFGRIMDATVTMQVEYDDAHAVDYRAGTEKSWQMQIGTNPLSALGIWAPRMQHVAEPKRIDKNGRAAMELTFRCFADDTSTSLTGQNLEKFRSCISILRAA